MARRADHSHEELSELIISSAKEIVEDEGYRALTARRISEKIGYAVGTLYNHFENLDDIILQLNALTFDLLTDMLKEVSLTRDPRKDTLCFVTCYLRFLDKNPELWRMVFEHSLPEDQAPPPWYLKKAERTLSIFEQAIAPLYGGPCDDAKNATRILWSGLHGLTSLYVSGKLKNISEMSINEMAEKLVTNFIIGIEKKLEIS